MRGTGWPPAGGHGAGGHWSHIDEHGAVGDRASEGDDPDFGSGEVVGLYGTTAAEPGAFLARGFDGVCRAEWGCFVMAESGRRGL